MAVSSRALRLCSVAPAIALLAACVAAPPPPPSSNWFEVCPITAATASSIVGEEMRQITPDGETPWCQFQAAQDGGGVLVLNLDDRPGNWTLAEFRQAGEESSANCTDSDTPSLGPNAFSTVCSFDEDYRFVVGSAHFEVDGSVVAVSISKGYRRAQPSDLAGLAVAIARELA